MVFRPIEEVRKENIELIGKLRGGGFDLDVGKLHERIAQQAGKYDVNRAIATNPALAKQEEIWGVEGGKALGVDELDRLANNTLVALRDADAMLRNVEGRKATSVIVMGSSGSGKTTFTRAVSEAIKKGNLMELADGDAKKESVFEPLQTMGETSPDIFNGGLFPLNKGTFSQLEALGYDPEKHAETFWKIRSTSAAAKEMAQTIFAERKQSLGHHYDNYEESLMDPTPGVTRDNMMAVLQERKKDGQKLAIIYVVPEGGVEGAVANDKARGEGPEKRSVGEDAVRAQYAGAAVNAPELANLADVFVKVTLPKAKALDAAGLEQVLKDSVVQGKLAFVEQAKRDAAARGAAAAL